MDAFFSADDRQEHLALLSQSASKPALDFLVSDELSRSLCGGAWSGEIARLHVPEEHCNFPWRLAGNLWQERFHSYPMDERKGLGSLMKVRQGLCFLRLLSSVRSD
jgi:hypothetical protein